MQTQTKDYNESDYLNVTEKETVSTKDLGENSTFLETPIIPIPKNVAVAILRTHHILDYIRENPSCTAYEISKKLEIDYAIVSKATKDLEYCRLIFIKPEIADNSRTHKKLYVPEEVGK